MGFHIVGNVQPLVHWMDFLLIGGFEDVALIFGFTEGPSAV